MIVGEIALWRAVVHRALQDAMGHLGSLYDGGDPQREALEWFNTKDFELVCEYAGLDPDVVRKAKPMRINSTSPQPENVKRIAEILAKKRREKSLTLQNVASRIGTLSTSVQNWESGYRIPNSSSLEKWANALGYEVVLREK